MFAFKKVAVAVVVVVRIEVRMLEHFLPPKTLSYKS